MSMRSLILVVFSMTSCGIVSVSTPQESNVEDAEEFAVSVTLKPGAIVAPKNGPACVVGSKEQMFLLNERKKKNQKPDDRTRDWKKMKGAEFTTPTKGQKIYRLMLKSDFKGNANLPCNLSKKKPIYVFETDAKFQWKDVEPETQKLEAQKTATQSSTEPKIQTSTPTAPKQEAPKPSAPTEVEVPK